MSNREEERGWRKVYDEKLHNSSLQYQNDKKKEDELGMQHAGSLIVCVLLRIVDNILLA